MSRARTERRLFKGPALAPPKGELRAVKLAASSAPGAVGISMVLEDGRVATAVVPPDLAEAWASTLLEVVDKSRALAVAEGGKAGDA